MGILKNIRDFINGEDIKRSIEVMGADGNAYSFADWSKKFVTSQKTPIQEAVYNTIANEFSKIDLFAERIDNKPLVNDQYNNVLNVRTNEFLTPNEWKHLTAYQLAKYSNSLTYINRDKDGNVLKLTPINLDNYQMGNGYQLANGTLLIKLKNKANNTIELIDYSNIIHLRLTANNIFNADLNPYVNGSNTLINIIDSQLNVMLNEMLASGEIRGIIKVGNASASSLNNALLSNEKKKSKQDEIADRIRNANGSILVLDSGEEWQSLNSPFESVSKDNINKVMSLFYTFNGINERVINGTATFDEMEVFFNKTIAPIIEQLIEELNYKLLTEKERKKIRIDYKRNPYEYISITSAVDSAYKGAMFTTINEMRKMLYKLPPIEGGDVLMSNKNFEVNNASENENGGN